MSCTLNDEYKLHYRTEGNGPLVVLIHGLLMNGESWRQSGLVQVLRERFCVAYPDLLGHGMSDKPVTSGPYDQDKQAAGIVRLINEAGYRKAHIIGYSSGAWLALGIAKYYPQHLSSLLIGGWDVENGLPDGPNGPLSFDEFLNYAKLTAPELTKWLTPAIEPAVRASFNALGCYQSMGDILQSIDIPKLFLAGVDDVYHNPLKAYADANAFPFLSAPGNHVSAMLQPDIDTINSICLFITRANAGTEA